VTVVYVTHRLNELADSAEQLLLLLCASVPPMHCSHRRCCRGVR